LIFGPVVAASCQEMQRSRTEDEFCRSDEDHPVPRLRPVIYNKILQQSRFADRQAWVEKLARRWKSSVEMRNVEKPTEFVVSEGQGPASRVAKHADNSVLINQAIAENGSDLDVTKPIDKLIEIILSTVGNLEDHWPRRLPYPDLPPLEPNNDDVTLCALYTWFEQVRTVVVGLVNVPDSLVAVDLNSVWADWRKAQGFDLLPKPDPEKTVIPFKVWLEILEAGGWTTEIGEKPWP